jgi:4-alpha-glucanotransferase
MNYKRSSGILIHPTSLPGKFGVGDIGINARDFIDLLNQSGCSLWQVLPLGPTGYGDSPYQCFSAFAGNPYLISPQDLLEDNLLHPDDLVDIPTFQNDKVDYGQVIYWKLNILDRSYLQFEKNPNSNFHRSFQEFKHEQSYWLTDFALFMAIKEAHGGAPWTTWEPGLRDRKSSSLEEARIKFDYAIQRQMYRQFIFFQQWQKLREYAHAHGIQIIGDAPIFVAHDSSDVWVHRELFFLDKKGNPTVVAGVPPDYFSPTGQLWGNPLYNWKMHQEDGYDWWYRRMRSVLSLVDILRLDHFRGFAGYWEVPADDKTAENGRWVSGPGKHFFDVLQNKLGELPIIAEDLGVITPDVVEMRQAYELPGMKILQFGFEGSPDDPFLPHNYPVNCVVYTGTHDNDTVKGWYERVSPQSRDFCRRYLARGGNDLSWDFIRAIWSSVAMFAIAPMQDFLSLGNEARMNYPGNPSGNWSWRMRPNAFNQNLVSRISEINYLYSRKNIDESNQ